VVPVAANGVLRPNALSNPRLAVMAAGHGVAVRRRFQLAAIRRKRNNRQETRLELPRRPRALLLPLLVS
jgi:hypothetical protein